MVLSVALRLQGFSKLRCSRWEKRRNCSQRAAFSPFGRINEPPAPQLAVRTETAARVSPPLTAARSSTGTRQAPPSRRRRPGRGLPHLRGAAPPRRPSSVRGRRKARPGPPGRKRLPPPPAESGQLLNLCGAGKGAGGQRPGAERDGSDPPSGAHPPRLASLHLPSPHQPSPAELRAEGTAPAARSPPAAVPLPSFPRPVPGGLAAGLQTAPRLKAAAFSRTVAMTGDGSAHCRAARRPRGEVAGRGAGPSRPRPLPLAGRRPAGGARAAAAVERLPACRRSPAARRERLTAADGGSGDAEVNNPAPPPSS